MHVPTQRVVRSSMQLVHQHNPKLACATSLQATVTHASCSVTTQSNVLEWVQTASWETARPITSAIVLGRALQLRLWSHWARVARCDQSRLARRTHAHCSTTQRSSVGARVSMDDWDMRIRSIAVTRLGKWATCCQRLRWVPTVQHSRSRLVHSIRARCSTIIRSSVGAVAPMASWALALQPPSAMKQARWAIRCLPWRLPLDEAHALLRPVQTTRAPFSITRRLSVGVAARTANLVRAQLPTSDTRVLQLLQQHSRST